VAEWLATLATLSRVRPKDLAALVVLAAIWGGSFVVIRVAVADFGPAALMGGRVVVAGLMLLAAAAAMSRLPDLRARWRQYAVIGVVSAAAPFSLIALSEVHLTGSLAAILNATTPLFTAVVAALWTRAPITRGMVLGLALGIAGVGVLVGWSPLPVSVVMVLSVLASLAGALCYAAGAVYTARALRGESSLSLSIGQQLSAAVWLVPLAAVLHPTHAPSGAAIASLLVLAVICTAVAYLIYFPLLAGAGPTSALSVTFLVPFFGVLWGGIFLHEPVGGGTVPGLVLIVAAILLVSRTRLRPPLAVAGLGRAAARR